METNIDRPWLSHYDPGVPAHLSYPDEDLTYFLRVSANRFPGRSCTLWGNASVSYSVMESVTDRLAPGLAGLGLKPGERVAILLPNIPQFVAAYYGVLKAGGVVVALNPQYTSSEIVRLLNETQAVYLIGLSTSYEMIQSIQQQTEIRSVILTTLEESAVEGEDFLEPGIRTVPAIPLNPSDSWLHDLGMNQGDAVPLPKISGADPAVFQYTGGTTGIPKAAVGLHRNLVANTLQFKAWLGSLEDGKETFLVAIPLYHVYGMVLGMSLAMAMGATMVLVSDPRDLNGLLATIEKRKPTVFPGVPSMYNAIIRFPGISEGAFDISSLRICISGSAPLSADTKERFERLISGRLVEGYGLSEAPTATHCNPVLGDNRTGSIGLPLPDVDCRVVSLDDGKTVLPVGEVGELLIRSPQVMQGYHAMVEETQAALENGWLHTGDIVRMDADGYFYVIDRKKEVIKSGGFQVWPREIEDVLNQHPKILEAGVVGIPHEIRGEVPKAYVVTKPGESVSAEELKTWCARSLARYKIPVQFAFIDRLPRSPVGKLLRRELRNRA